MSCTDYTRWFSPYVDGLLALGERVQLEAHLKDCAHCRADLAGLQEMLRSLRSMGRVEAPELLPGIHRKLNAQPWWYRLFQQVTAPWPSSLPWHSVALATTAILVVIIAGLPSVFKPPGLQDRRSSRSFEVGDRLRRVSKKEQQRAQNEKAFASLPARSKAKEPLKQLVKDIPAALPQSGLEEAESARDESWQNTKASGEGFAEFDRVGQKKDSKTLLRHAETGTASWDRADTSTLSKSELAQSTVNGEFYDYGGKASALGPVGSQASPETAKPSSLLGSAVAVLSGQTSGGGGDAGRVGGTAFSSAVPREESHRSNEVGFIAGEDSERLGQIAAFGNKDALITQDHPVPMQAQWHVPHVPSAAVEVADWVRAHEGSLIPIDDRHLTIRLAASDAPEFLKRFSDPAIVGAKLSARAAFPPGAPPEVQSVAEEDNNASLASSVTISLELVPSQ